MPERKYDTHHRRLPRTRRRPQRRRVRPPLRGRRGARRAAELRRGHAGDRRRLDRRRRAPHRELARRSRGRDARPPLRLAARDHRRDRPSHPALPGRADEGAARAGARRPLAPGRTRPVPHAARGDAGRDRDRGGRRPPTRPRTSPSTAIPSEVAIASERAARLHGLEVIAKTSATTPRRSHASSPSRPTCAST